MNEPFVDVETIAQHLRLTKRQVLKLVRKGSVPAHAIDPSARRKTWRFKVSEVDKVMGLYENRLVLGGPVSPSKRRS